MMIKQVKIRKQLLTMIFLLGLLNTGYAQESKFKALFIFKFSEYVIWPPSSTPFVIGVIGDSDVYSQLVLFASASKEVSVKKLKSSAEASLCSIVFISESRENEINDISNLVGKKSILIIGETDKYVGKGADIGFFQEENKLKFLIDKVGIESKKMTPSSKLMILGKVL